MGSIVFNPESLADSLSETAGYKAGLALSLNELCDHLSGTIYPDILRQSETQPVRLRSEEYEDVFYKLLHRIGYTEEEYDGDFTGAKLYHKYKDSALEEWLGVTELFTEIWPLLVEETIKSGAKKIDPSPFIKVCAGKYGRLGINMAMERIEVLNKAMHMNPHNRFRYINWATQIQLTALFNGSKGETENGRFIDQRYIDYLSVNEPRLSDMHWRKFEELTAEFYHREGYEVELGPGTNDDGVDVRVWQAGKKIEENPHILIQCKRQKAKVEKVIVKGLHADVQFEEAEYGVIVTTSELSPGARNTIVARGYPINEIDRTGLTQWLKKLRSPGTGIVRV
ncbi:MAG TPA: restriction endonuclease [Methylotenera sp.]|nr:restriction endonuclease [Methylotenera sp.]